MLTLRPYQTDARYQLNALLNASRHPVFVSPTGTGKTKTATAVIADRVSIGRRVFVLVPSVEIFTQWITDLSDAGLNPGYINDEGMKGQNRSVYVCMAQSLVNILDRVPESLWPDEIFTDECVSGDTIISTDVGDIKISDVVSLGAKRVLSYNGTDYVYSKIIRLIESGVKDVYEITTDSGKKIKCTKNHLLFSEEKWQTADTLKPGSQISVNVGVGEKPEETNTGIRPRGYPDTGYIKENQKKIGKQNIRLFLKTLRYARADVVKKQIHNAEHLNDISKKGIIRDIINTVFLMIKGSLDGTSKFRKSKKLELSEHCSETDVSSSLQKEGKVRAYVGLTDCAKKNGWNTRLKTCRQSGLKRRLLKTVDTENGRCAEDQEACPVYCRYTDSLLKTAKRQSQAKFYQIFPMRLLRGGFAMTARVLKTAYFFIHKGFQKKKMSLLKTIFKINTELVMSERITGKTCILYRLALMPLGFCLMILKTVFPSVCSIRYETIISIKKIGRAERVYDLEIEGTHCYFANGILSHNCHHSAASTWETIYTFFGRATRCGLTATPERLDGKGLDHLYTDIVQTITMKEAIDAGYLAKPLPIVPQKYLDTHDIPDGNPDTPGALEAQAAKLGKLEIIGDVLESYRHIFHGKPVLVACATFGHAELMAEKFCDDGWNFEHIHSGLSKQERRRMLRGIRSGTIHGLCTVGIGIEGMDIPGLYGLIWLRRTRSLTIYLQMVGRTLRPLPGKKYGIILDPVGNLFLHGFPEADRVWSLSGRGDSAGAGSEPPEVPMRICPWCGVANNPENERCHFCNMQLLDEDGNRITKKRDLPSFVSGQLIAVTSDGDRQAVENAIIEDVEAVTEAQKKAEQKEATALTNAEKKDILVQGIFAGRERRPLFNEAVRGMVRRGGLD